MDGTWNNNVNDDALPLSWEDARWRLCKQLDEYLDHRPSPAADRRLPPRREGGVHRSLPIVSWCVHHDLDLYLGALPLSLALLVLAVLTTSGNAAFLHLDADPIVYRAQLAAAVLLLIGSTWSLWMVRRRQFLTLNDSGNAKHREIFRFLRSMKKLAETQRAGPAKGVNFELEGTAMTDIYPVYRWLDKTKPCATWSKVPSLLLVEGDLIALQIGDISPANCTLIDSSAANVHVVNAQRLTLDLFGETGDHVFKSLPKGRSTIEESSKHLGTLCNRMRVFKITRTPLLDFVHREPVAAKPSQISRQVQAVREVQAIFAIVVFFLTGLIVFSRPSATKGDVAILIPMPLLAALAVLPVIGPALAFFLEVLGTARILKTVHPYANAAVDGGQGSYNSQSETRLLARYIFSAILSRLSLWHAAGWAWNLFDRWCKRLDGVGGDSSLQEKLVRVPPASINLLEKLGVATAFTLVDDELACEPHALPQQLLVPSGNGLKLLDLCPAYDSDSEHENESETEVNARKRGKSVDSDSESDDGTQGNFHNSLRRKVLRRRLLRKKKAKRQSERDDTENDGDEPSYEVQFEDPMWWQHLPSLKCIGLACLLVDDCREAESHVGETRDDVLSSIDVAHRDLVSLICKERRSSQMRALAQCIGFSTEKNMYGDRGDISPFEEKQRVHVISSALFRERLKLDAHERSSEQSRWWGLLRPDSTSVIIQDVRTKAFQLLTVGDPVVVTKLCNEAWQGEIATILPLASDDRETIIETTNNWKLADLDVAAFSYSPVPLTLEAQLSTGIPKKKMYLLDHGEPHASFLKERNVSKEWMQIKNQIFLGVLGSLKVPRREIQRLLSVLSDAGVRFVYFSPRNMRRQKELASQMGIDVAWNCAISLRPLESGEADPHRMVSNYADWSVNARLPHGVSAVRQHLQEVDNVPLLVSLFTDATKDTTKEMVEIFQEYHDTVVAVGLSHLPSNDGIFAAADIAVGIDTLTDSKMDCNEEFCAGGVLRAELDFVSAISAHACAFRFQGASSVSFLSTILEKSRASLEAATSAGIFNITSCVSYSFYVLLSACSPGTNIPFVPTLGSVLFMQMILPSLGFALAMTDGDKNTMKVVPPKNDQSIVFRKQEGKRLYSMIGAKAVMPALLCQIFSLVAFGELTISFEPELVSSECGGASTWVDITRCDAFKDYAGNARIDAGCLVLAQFTLCIIISSAGFVHRFSPVTELFPWEGSNIWIVSVVFSLGLVILYLFLSLNKGVAEILPWYYYLMSAIAPFLCLAWVEVCKRIESKHERRAEKLRRLQFETRLGAWSPK